jgi:hypothetical protein
MEVLGMNFPSKDIIAAVRKQYPAGLQVVLVRMEDPHARLRPGEKGIVDSVDDTGTIHVSWDKGPTLGVVYGVDEISILPPVHGLRCKRCGGPIYSSELPQYAYQCYTCDEDLYEIEVEKAV